MRFARYFIGSIVGARPACCGIVHRRVAHVTLPSAAIDVTALAALDVGGGTGSEVLGCLHVVNGTAGAGGIDILVDGATEQVDIGGATDGGIGTQTAAVSVVAHGGSPVDMDVGVVLLAVQGGSMYQGAFQAVVQIEVFVVFVCIFDILILIARQTKVKGCTFVIPPFVHRLRVHHPTVVAAAIDLIDLGTVQQVDFSILRPSVLTGASTEDGSLVAGAVTSYISRIDRHVDVDLSIQRSVGMVVAAEDFLHRCKLAVVVHLSLIDVAGDFGVVAVGTAEDTVNLNRGATGHVDQGAAGDTLLVAAAKDAVDLAACQVDDGRDFGEVVVGNLHGRRVIFRLRSRRVHA